ncbi:HlyD family type I secretion periplasmic adaptor subunit [Sedimentitalea todarodis]|uniref:Membrane fusion protein (MFP) family protein n=1 Tax=Sedimentitalea todarodis TaxID=1631240 RepID=A0ABU3VKN8_9RHOB|nr:HlyD family type I secretion periplasmic adaptor subunit [Sedimentitalea todarodis]MDU9006721.1 HlyD family type I secretion periplasmic adaptor subunit [Sedimentitalea todarodis]
MQNKPTDIQLDLGETDATRWIKRAAGVAVLGVAALVVWMVVTTVDEVAKARGEVEPISQVHRVESRHGGQLQEVLVSKGQFVEQGDVVAIMDQVEAQSALDAANARIAGHVLAIERMLSLVEGRDADFENYREFYPDLVKREEASLAAIKEFARSERATIRAQIDEKKAEVAAIDAQLPQLNRQIEVAEEERSVQEDLRERGLGVRAPLAELREQEAQYRFDLARLAGRRSVAEAEITELESSLTGLDLQEYSEARDRIVETEAELRALRAEADGLLSRIEETRIHAPIAGLVQSVPDDTVGDVIDPGGVVVTIVPAAGGFRFAGRLSPRDVGFVAVGQPVRVKIDSFDYSRFGSLSGKVEEVSPTTLLDEQGAPYYEVQVALEADHFRASDSGLRLLPGMTGEADITTGQKTVFQYVWKPIYTNLDLALSER